MRRRHYHCQHCGASLGRMLPAAGGHVVLMLFSSQGIEEPDDAPRLIRCKKCGEMTPWDGEIRLPKAA